MACKHPYYRINEEGALVCTECGKPANSDRKQRRAEEVDPKEVATTIVDKVEKMGPQAEDKSFKKPEVNKSKK